MPEVIHFFNAQLI